MPERSPASPKSFDCQMTLEPKRTLSANCPKGRNSAPLLAPPFSNILKPMEVHFTPEQEKRLTQIAANAGTDPERLVKDAALRLLEQQAGSPPLPAGSVLDEMRALRARIKPDPEGWTTRDYIQYGRR